MSDVNKQLLDVAEKLKKAGASVPAPQAAGTIESAMRHGLSIALAVVEEAIAAAEQAQQAQQAEPVAWVRFCSDGCYEGPIMNSDSRMDSVRRTSGAWTPLYATQPPAVAVPDEVAKDAARYRWLRQDESEFSSMAPAELDAAIDKAIAAAQKGGA